MERKQYLRLKKDLIQYKNECLNSSSDNNLNNAILIIVNSLDQQLIKPVIRKEKDINIIIDLIEKNDIEKINTDYPKIKYYKLQHITNSNIDINSLVNYTIIELKIIYYLFTKDKENNAIKTNKKEPVLNAVKEVIFNSKRTQKLENKQF